MTAVSGPPAAGTAPRMASPDISRPAGPGFVVERHPSRGRHHELLLRVDGTSLRWALPAGPPPGTGRCAAYLLETGPEQESTAGVEVWDQGACTPVGTEDPAEAVRRGELHVDLDGERLHGRFALLRCGHEEDSRWHLARHTSG